MKFLVKIDENLVFVEVFHCANRIYARLNLEIIELWDDVVTGTYTEAKSVLKNYCKSEGWDFVGVVTSPFN